MQHSANWTLVSLDHVQLAMPVGGEEAARQFYVGVLGLREIPKPAAMAARGGCWFERGALKLHLGAEADFRPARKAHPALVVRGLDSLLDAHDLLPVWSNDIPGSRRCHINDPFGNRLELIDATS